MKYEMQYLILFLTRGCISLKKGLRKDKSNLELLATLENQLIVRAVISACMRCIQRAISLI